MAKWDSPNNIAILMMVALQPPHFSIAVYSPALSMTVSCFPAWPLHKHLMSFFSPNITGLP